jgi:hypothetical protein
MLAEIFVGISLKKEKSKAVLFSFQNEKTKKTSANIKRLLL